MSYTIQVIPIHYLDILCLKNFLFQPNNIDFALLAYLVNADMMGFSMENNTDKPIYMSQNFCFGHIQKLTYPNIEQLHSQEVALAKQIPYNQHKKAWLKKVVITCYSTYEEQ